VRALVRAISSAFCEVVPQGTGVDSINSIRDFKFHKGHYSPACTSLAF
jgi:hypothetical protein